MTREEALNWIVDRKEHYELGEETQELAEALSIAASDMKKLDRIEDIMHIEMNGKEALQEIERILSE